MRLPILLGGSILVAGLLAGCSSQPSPPPASSPPPPGASSTASPDARKTAFRAAANELSRQVNAPVDSIAGVSQDETTWNDSCLGCPQTGESCSQVLTPGYRVVLRVSDATYEYHTDLGGRAKLCSQH
jgi:hypothetical protein